MATMEPPSGGMARTRIPVVFPDVRDPRLHTAGVILSIHVIGATALAFRVSIPQIIAAVVTAAVIDFFFLFRSTGRLMWPASGVLTGSGVALILRVVGMPSGDLWTGTGWHYFALVAGLSVLGKYLIKVRGAHVFNPSNLGLVVAFLVLGSSVVEPLDFWWAPLDLWMALAYLIIVGAGILITRRLRLLEMAITFWLVLAAGLAVLSFSGHCMTAAWSVDPVCGLRFWTVLVTSPEILVFLFFMITDPKTVPERRLARIVFAATLATMATILIAPQTVEFGAKVALLGSLVIWSPLRGVFDRFFPLDVGHESVSASLATVAFGRTGRPSRSFSVGFLAGAILVLTAGIIVLAGGPARQLASSAVPPRQAMTLDGVDPSDLPEVVVEASAEQLSFGTGDLDPDAMALTLVQNLRLEAEAIRRADTSLLTSADGGVRLLEMQQKINEAIVTGTRPISRYDFDSLTLRAAETRGQGGAALAFDGTGTLDDIVYDAAGREQTRSASRFDATFVMRYLGGGHWVIVEVMSPAR